MEFRQFEPSRLFPSRVASSFGKFFDHVSRPRNLIQKHENDWIYAVDYEIFIFNLALFRCTLDHATPTPEDDASGRDEVQRGRAIHQRRPTSNLLQHSNLLLVAAHQDVAGSFLQHTKLIGYRRCRARAKREHLRSIEGLLPESRSHNLALTVLSVPCSLDSGLREARSVSLLFSSLSLSSLELSDTKAYEP